MRLYFLPIFISIIVLGSCKKSNNNETPESQFKQYEGTWLVAETDNGGSTINYTTNLTFQSDATSKTMNASLTYFPDGGVGISGSTLNAIKE